MYANQNTPSSSTPIPSGFVHQRPFPVPAPDTETSSPQPSPDSQARLEVLRRANPDWSKVKFSTPPAKAVQPRLTVGAPNDQYEQEADRVADQVMSMPDTAVPQPVQRDAVSEEEEVRTKPLAASITPLIQRVEVPEEDEKAVQPKAIASIQREALPEENEEINPIQPKAIASIQREELTEEDEETNPIQPKTIATSDLQREEIPEDEGEMQRKPLSHSTLQRSPDGGFEADGNLESRLSSSQGGGSPLSDDVRSFMEPRFGADFSQVRVHTGSDAVQMNQDLNAQAFTHKQDVYFGAGKAPGNDSLMAHELTHVVQQTEKSLQFQQIQTNPSEQEQAERVQKLNEDYKSAVHSKDWVRAAELLNGFNQVDILVRLKKLNRGYVVAMRQGALENPAVGGQSQIVLIADTILQSAKPPSLLPEEVTQAHSPLPGQADVPFLGSNSSFKGNLFKAPPGSGVADYAIEIEGAFVFAGKEFHNGAEVLVITGYNPEYGIYAGLIGEVGASVGNEKGSASVSVGVEAVAGYKKGEGVSFHKEPLGFVNVERGSVGVGVAKPLQVGKKIPFVALKPGTASPFGYFKIGELYVVGAGVDLNYRRGGEDATVQRSISEPLANPLPMIQKVESYVQPMLQRDEDDDQSKIIDFGYDLSLPPTSIVWKDKDGKPIQISSAVSLELALKTKPLLTTQAGKFKFSFGRSKLTSALSAAITNDNGATTSITGSAAGGIGLTIFEAKLTSSNAFLPKGTKFTVSSGWDGSVDSSNGQLESKSQPSLLEIKIPLSKKTYFEVAADPSRVNANIGGQF